MDKIRREIKMGDSIFARITMGGKIIGELRLNGVGSFSDVLDKIRQMIEGLRGLVKLFVRNQSRGWAEERNIMFSGAHSF